MNLKQIIESVSKTKTHESYPDWEAFCGAVGMGDLVYDYKAFTSGLKGYFFSRWLCTDTWVGWRVYFLRGMPVAVSCQPARKSDEEIEFLSIPHARMVKDFMAICSDEPLHEYPIIDHGDMTKDLGDGYKVEHGDSVLNNAGIIEETGETVLISKVWRSYSDIDKWSDVKVRHEGGRFSVIDVGSIIFEYGT